MSSKQPCVCTHDRVEYVYSSVHSTLKYVLSFETFFSQNIRVYNLLLYTRFDRGVFL